MDLLFGGGGGGNAHLSSAAAAGQQQPSWAAAGQLHLSPAQQQQQSHAAAMLASHSTSPHAADMSGPILYTEPNRTSAIDDVRSGVIYIFIVTVFLSFFLILPGIRNDKLPTFLCITTSLLVASIILVGLFGTTWHVGEAQQMLSAYKAFSRDRIQGELSVRIGLQSVNISLRAHKYFIMHELEGPIVLMDAAMLGAAGVASSKRTSLLANLMPVSPVITMRTEAEETQDIERENSGAASRFIANRTDEGAAVPPNSSLADELLNARTADGVSVDTELESEEAFSGGRAARSARSGAQTPNNNNITSGQSEDNKQQGQRNKRDNINNKPLEVNDDYVVTNPNRHRKPKYTIRRVNNVDINYNERFYWIEPQQMIREYHHALERGLPYPILTVVEYLSQDEAGFNWSRQYRAAGYYTSMLLWLAASLCVLMFCLHCAAPKYGIYTMQLIGCLLLFTNLTYSTLVPGGDKKLVIPFEGQPLKFKFGLSFWLVLIGGCISLTVGTIIVIIDSLFPNFILTTVLDVDYDSHQDYYMKQKYLNSKQKAVANFGADSSAAGSLSKRPELPDYLMKDKSIITMRRTSIHRLGEDDGERSVKTNSDKTVESERVDRLSVCANDMSSKIDADKIGDGMKILQLHEGLDLSIAKIKQQQSKTQIQSNEIGRSAVDLPAQTSTTTRTTIPAPTTTTIHMGAYLNENNASVTQQTVRL